MKFKPGDIITRVDREKGGASAHMGELVLMVVEPNNPKVPLNGYEPTGYWSCLIIKSPRTHIVGQTMRFFDEKLNTQYRRVDFGV